MGDNSSEEKEFQNEELTFPSHTENNQIPTDCNDYTGERPNQVIFGKSAVLGDFVITRDGFGCHDQPDGCVLSQG